MVRPTGYIGNVDVLVSLHQIADTGDLLFESVIVTDNSHVLGHCVAEFAPEVERVFLSVHAFDPLILRRSRPQLRSHFRVGFGRSRGFQTADIFQNRWPGNLSAGQAGKKRVRTESVRAMILVIALPDGE